MGNIFSGVGRRLQHMRQANTPHYGTYWWWWAFARHPHTGKQKFMVDGAFNSEEEAYNSANLLLSGQEFDVFQTNNRSRNEATRRARQLFAEKNKDISIALQNASHKVHDEYLEEG